MFYKGSKKIKHEDLQAKMEKRQYEFEMSLDDPSLDEDQNQAGLKFSSIFFAFTFLAIYCYLYTNKIKWPILESPKKLIKAAT